MMMKEQNIIVGFHIGRGGRFHNSGHKTYVSDWQRLSDCFNDNSFIIQEDEELNPLPDEKWRLIDGGGNVILEGRDNIESMTGILDWDGEYDTDIVKYIDDCDETEMNILYSEYLNEHSWMPETVKEYICRYKGLKRIKNVDCSLKYEAHILCTDGTELVFDWDGTHDVTEEDAREWMTENNIDPVSSKKYAEKFEKYYYVGIE